MKVCSCPRLWRRRMSQEITAAALSAPHRGDGSEEWALLQEACRQERECCARIALDEAQQLWRLAKAFIGHYPKEDELLARYQTAERIAERIRQGQVVLAVDEELKA